MTTPTLLADELLELCCDADPVRATLQGVRDRDDRLPDVRAQAEAALRDRGEDIRVRAMGLDTSRADLEDRLTVAVVVHQAQVLVDRFDSFAPEYSVVGNLLAPLAGLLFHLGEVPVADAGQARDFLTRLRRFPQFTEALAQRHREGVVAGRVPVRPLLDDAVRHIDDQLAAPETNPLLGPDLPDAELEAERKRLLADVVHPALRRYRAVLAAEIAPHARPAERPGLCWLPDGREIYRRLVRAHTTTDRDPRELHAVGLDRLDALRQEFSEVGARALGLDDPAAILRRLNEDPALFWRDGEELLSSARAAIARADRAAPAWFGALPRQRCEVRPMPGTPSPSAPAGCYLSPALDGSRPGVFYANTHQAERRQRFLSEVCAFHEVVPGHHVQLSLALERDDLPLLRRLMTITAYSEGWGLYTERLADEMGLYSDDLARLGMVAVDALRAARLVVDTGLHEFGWSREQAVEFLGTRTALPPLEAAAEVDRYIVHPAQALSYLVGRLEIERVRDAARRRLGPDFDIRRFHDVVLGHGPLPLSTLDTLVAEELAGPPATSR